MSAREAGGVSVLRAEGLLDTTTYLSMRDAIIKAALDEPAAVIVDVTALVVPAPTAWAVFTSARWHVGQWPDVPVAIVCAHSEGRDALALNGITRYVPVYPSLNEAIAAAAHGLTAGLRHRIRVELPLTPASVARSRELTAKWLTAWDRPELIAVAKLVVTVFVENVFAHTDSAPTVRLEVMGDLMTVAVEDSNSAPAMRLERSHAGADRASGLAIVASLAKAWGNSPTPSGKTVWAVMGPGNEL